ncbi:unnamed protein product [Sphagnum jensenii]
MIEYSVMSIESDKSQGKNRSSDIMDRLDPHNRYSSSNHNSTEMVVEGERSGSFGTAGRLIPVNTVPRMNSLTECREYHSCDCYRRCLGRACNCFQFMEPCVEKRCCVECIEMKKELLLEKEELERQENRFFPQQSSMPMISFLTPSPVPQDFHQQGGQINIFANLNQQHQHHQTQQQVVHSSPQYPQHRFSHTPPTTHLNGHTNPQAPVGLEDGAGAASSSRASGQIASRIDHILDAGLLQIEHRRHRRLHAMI